VLINHLRPFFTEKHRRGRSNWIRRWSFLRDNTFQLFQGRRSAPLTYVCWRPWCIQHSIPPDSVRENVNGLSEVTAC